VCERRCRR
jgi:hypothetical protein